MIITIITDNSANFTMLYEIEMVQRTQLNAHTLPQPCLIFFLTCGIVTVGFCSWFPISFQS